MLSIVARSIVRNTIVKAVLRGLGTAVVAGVGVKLGSDVYDAVKKRLGRRRGKRAKDTDAMGSSPRC